MGHEDEPAEQADDLALLVSGGDRDDVYTAMGRLRARGALVAPALRRIAGELTVAAGGRSRAIDTLARLTPVEPDTTRLLMALLADDESVLVRWTAATALGTIGDRLAMPVLAQAASADEGRLEVSPGFDVSVRQTAASALARLEKSK